MGVLTDIIKANLRYLDILKNPTGVIATIVVGLTTLHFCRRLLFQYHWTFTTVQAKQSYDEPRDREAQMKARDAAEHRHKTWKAKQSQKKWSTIKSLNTPPINAKKDNKETLITEAVVRKHDASASTSMSMEEIIAASLPVYDDGFILFRNLFQMPDADRTASTLRRLGQEFIPIIQQRQYNVTSVSELCCCGDGMDYQFGFRSLSARPGERIAGHDSERVMGYNRVVLPNSNIRHGKQRFNIDIDKYTSSIHLRLRSPHDHSVLIPYEQVCEHMCHELAHCVYHDHSTEFYTLMRDIQQQHRNSVSVSR